VADVRERVESIEAGTDRQLETVQENLDVLDETLGQAYAAIGDVDIWVSSTVSIADDLQIILGNELVPAVYISRCDDGHESALPRESLPELSCCRRRWNSVSGTVRRNDANSRSYVTPTLAPARVENC
jgi:hypothetical protein